MYTFHSAKFRQIITEKGWSLAALARALNTPVSTVSGWANGRHQPTLGNVERLATWLQCPVDTLWLALADTTPGRTGAVPLTRSQGLVLAVAVALAAQDADTLAQEWRRRLRPGELHRLDQDLLLTPQWHWAWTKLRKLSQPVHPLQGYGVQVKLDLPRKERARG